MKTTFVIALKTIIFLGKFPRKSHSMSRHRNKKRTSRMCCLLLHWLFLLFQFHEHPPPPTPTPSQKKTHRLRLIRTNSNRWILEGRNLVSAGIFPMWWEYDNVGKSGWFYLIRSVWHYFKKQCICLWQYHYSYTAEIAPFRNTTKLPNSLADFLKISTKKGPTGSEKWLYGEFWCKKKLESLRRVWTIKLWRFCCWKTLDLVQNL